MEQEIKLHASNLNTHVITTEINSAPDKLQIKNPQLIKIFEDELKEIYWSEKALVQYIEKMREKASSRVLVETLELHLEEKYKQIRRLENAFVSLDKIPDEKRCCKAMNSLIKESEGMLNKCQVSRSGDTSILFAGQKLKQYEIGIYSTLRLFAENLGFIDIALILEETLMEEIEANKKLSEILPYI